MRTLLRGLALILLGAWSTSLWAADPYSRPLCEAALIHALDIRNVSTRTPKVYPFPKTDLAQQRRYEADLTFLASLSALPPQNQCAGSCAAFSFATFYDYLIPLTGLQGPISGGYTTAKTFEVKLAVALKQHHRSVKVGSIGEERSAIQYSGVLPERLYPTRADVDTYKLARVLTSLAEVYWHYARRTHSSAALVDLRADYMKIGIGIIQHFFGTYPDNKALVRAGERTPVELRREIDDAFAPSGIRITVMDDNHDDLSKIATTVLPFLLGKKLPVHLSYRMDPRQVGENGVYSPHPPSDAHAFHAIMISGVATDSSGAVTLRAQNSHSNAPVIYLPVAVLEEHPWKLTALFSDADHHTVEDIRHRARFPL